MNNIPEILDRIEAKVKTLNLAENVRVEKQFKETYPALVRYFSDQSKFKRTYFFKTMKTLQLLVAGKGNFFTERTNPRGVADVLTELLSCSFRADRQVYSITLPIRPDLTDEDNIRADTTRDYLVETDRLNKARELIEDLIDMICQLAWEIDSCEKQRFLRCAVALKGRPGIAEPLSHEEAEDLVGELIYAFDAIRREIGYLPIERRAYVRFPKMPHHRPDIVVHVSPPEDWPADKCTKESLRRAEEKYRDDHFALLPIFGGLVEGDEGEIVRCARILAEISRKIENDEPTLDRGEYALDYSVLEDILKSEFFLWFEDFFIEEEVHNGQLISERRSESNHMETKESQLKDEIIKSLRAYLSKGAELAALCGSSTAAIWARAIANFEQNGGDYHAWAKEDELRREADLVAFLKDFRQARQQLWVDWQKRDLTKKPIAVTDDAAKETAKNTQGIKEHVEKIAANTTPQPRGRDDLIRIVKSVQADGLEDKIPGVKSVQTAIDYLRGNVTPTMLYYAESVWARDFAASFAANKKTKSKGGIESFWRSIRRQCSGKKASKKESLGPVPILDKGVEHLADDME